MVMQHYRDYIRRFGADVSLAAFARLYGFKQAGVNVKTPRGMDISFDAAQTPDEAEIKGFIDDIKRQQREKWEDELQTQRARLAKAEIDIAAKPTKKAEGDQQDYGACGTARGSGTDGTAVSGREDLPDVLRAGPDLGRRPPRGETDAVPLPTRR